MLKDFLEKIEARGENGPESSALAPARLAIYDSPAVAPRVVELTADDYDGFIGLIATKTYQFSQEKGGKLPFTIIKEVIENLIHAYFKEIVITILDEGNTIRISDQGPGIVNKDKAFEPGFSTATQDMKRFIRGVGSGLPIVKESLSLLGGAVIIEDNLSSGTVVTIRVPGKRETAPGPEPSDGDQPCYPLSYRQKKVLSLIMELSIAGPSIIAKSLGISLSTVYRDLLYLEGQGLVDYDRQGKRSLTPRGIELLSGRSN
ncbi:MAG: ATP-binding protein [Actinobacteria bacterium]|nr:ATP-binding protein [Actinomycetota bacterium]